MSLRYLLHMVSKDIFKTSCCLQREIPILKVQPLHQYEIDDENRSRRSPWVIYFCGTFTRARDSLSSREDDSRPRMIRRKAICADSSLHRSICLHDRAVCPECARLVETRPFLPENVMKRSVFPAPIEMCLCTR